MGLIARQTFKQSTVQIFGVMIGALSTIFLYPHAPHEYGLARFLLDSAAVLAPFALVGLSIVPIRFFPKFRNADNGHNGLLTIIAIILACAFLVFAAAFIFFDHLLLEALNPSEPEYQKYFIWILPITLLTASTYLLYNYTSNFGRIAMPYFFSNVIMKIGLPILIILLLAGYLAQQYFALGLIIVLFVSAVGLLFYLHSLGELRFRKPNFKLLKAEGNEIATYALFGLLGSIGSTMAFKIDSVMISSFKDFDSNGIYNIGLNIANVMAAPTLALVAITGPIISRYWNTNNTNEIEKIYKDSSISLLVVGGFMFILITTSMRDLISFFPSAYDYSVLQPIVLLLGLAKVFDMATSVNNQIILYSDYYKFNLIAMLLLGFFNIVLNYQLLVVFDLGIMGAAIASTASLFLFNVVKFIFILVKFRMQPFSVKILPLILIAVAIYFLASRVVLDWHPFVAIAVRSMCIAICYIPLIYYLKISTTVNNYIDKAREYISS